MAKKIQPTYTFKNNRTLAQTTCTIKFLIGRFSITRKEIKQLLDKTIKVSKDGWYIQ